MSKRKQSVLVVELDEELAKLENLVLSDAGYAVTATVCGPSSLKQAEKLQPDVILLDLGMHQKTCGWQLLQNLRSNANTQGIPILVISDTEQLLTDAKESFNVRQELIKPYDIEDLEKGIKAAVSGTPLLPHPAPPPTTGALSVLAADAISQHAGNIMAEWLKWLNRIQSEKALGSPPKVPIRVLMNNISVWLIGLISVLLYGSGEISGRSEIREKIRGHIAEARQHGITLGQIIKQFEILRDEARSTLEQANLENLTPADVFSMWRTLDGAIDEVMEQVAESYTESSEPSVTKTPLRAG